MATSYYSEEKLNQIGKNPEKNVGLQAFIQATASVIVLAKIKQDAGKFELFDCYSKL